MYSPSKVSLRKVPLATVPCSISLYSFDKVTGLPASPKGNRDLLPTGKKARTTTSASTMATTSNRTFGRFFKFCSLLTYGRRAGGFLTPVNDPIPVPYLNPDTVEATKHLRRADAKNRP